MIESWRWYGPLDNITLDEIAQTGASGIVTALHEIPYGEVWPLQTIQERRNLIRSNANLGLDWVVVESLPVHERIKRGDGDLEPLFENYRQSIINLAKVGVNTICYNFMPLLDWTRTDLTHPVARGGTALHFSAPKMAAFEVFMLDREAAVKDYSPAVLKDARVWFDASTDQDREELLTSIMSGLPGAYDRYDIPQLRDALKGYEGLDRAALRQNYKTFLEAVIPTAEECGVKMAVHPDDPPRNILGLPRIVSSGEDIDWILNSVDSSSNGLTLCSGSLGANPQNDVPAIAKQFSDKIHFAHLRNVSKQEDGSFTEAAHLDGDTDMVKLIQVLLDEDNRQQKTGNGSTIPYRPDHGHELLNDEEKQTHPGYPLIGRLRGLAELRGVMAGLSANFS